ncbi:polyprenyl synthetase family protein [Vulgatibacter incomptus]|uniref:Octaprenyl diphosphate synthase n=1 Tax=Vulgatibacter incomptus TaxID=1391653 RepID=A0A0K1PAW0_9BACT|nr:farnesyl diphosphate synthase [Vulgatibacter incomptus]AKU90642.1 Octaprenyl diphosphate synthase [Vulgatibacter incomptus]
MDLETYLRERKERIEATLAEHARDWEERVPEALAKAMAYSLLAGGKRLRPILCLAAFEGCEGARVAEAVALDFAVALELIHTYSLVHDDLPAMDDDDLRRGRPTCHKVFGEATAILAGDALLTEAFGILAGGDEPVRAKLVGLLARAAGAEGMVGGQQLDLDMTGRLAAAEPLPSLDEIGEIHRRKTGALLAVASEAGALAAGASDATVKALRAYGESLGLAFQIADDVLDVVGDAAAMGKSGRGDEAKGKPTYPALVGIDRARALAREARDRALSAIGELGEAAAPLRLLASYAIDRAS